jgi:hypothetical protein
MGELGSWHKTAREPEHAENIRTFHTALYNEASLIGQLCPGLRLCLAADVATGLMCDRCARVLCAGMLY